MSKTKRSSPGTTDWPQKFVVIKRVLGAFDPREVFVAVIPGTGGTWAAEIDKLYDRARRWHLHKPTGDRKFFDLLARRLECDDSVNGLSIVEASISEFIELLPSKHQVAARRALSGGVGDTIRDRVIHLDHTNEIQSIRAGVHEGFLDTRHYYSSADAAESWRLLVSAEQYPTYLHCKEGLQKLLTDSDWKMAMAQAAPATAVMLGGGGAPTKDFVLAGGLLRQSKKGAAITMVILDINPHMLIQSEAFHKEHRHTLLDSEHVRFEYRVADVLKLNDPAPVFVRNGPILFAMTGGTIGNLREGKFFQSLDRVAQSGDLLIISADTVDDLPQEKLIDGITKKYNHAEMQRFITPGIQAVLHEFRGRESVESALKRVQVRVMPKAVGEISDVPDSWSVTLVIGAEQREITLLSSTRYVTSSFAGFAAGFGWELICKVPSPLNSHFIQFAFRRK